MAGLSCVSTTRELLAGFGSGDNRQLAYYNGAFLLQYARTRFGENGMILA